MRTCPTITICVWRTLLYFFLRVFIEIIIILKSRNFLIYECGLRSSCKLKEMAPLAHIEVVFNQQHRLVEYTSLGLRQYVYGEVKRKPRQLLPTSRFPASFERWQRCDAFSLFLSERENFDAPETHVFRKKITEPDLVGVIGEIGQQF